MGGGERWIARSRLAGAKDLSQIALAGGARGPLRTCIHNLDPPSCRVFSHHAALNFLEINTIIPAKIRLA